MDLEAQLKNLLSEQHQCSSADNKKREAVVRKLESLLREWVSKKGSSHVPGDTEGDGGCRVMVFGGHALGVSTATSDLDVVCIVPSCVTSDEFFTEFPERLRNADGASLLRVVTGSFVPIIQSKIDGVEVDMSLCTLAMEIISPDADLLCDDILHSMEGKSIQALRGVRDTQALLALVPNVHIFRELLKVVKLWAKGHCLYGCPAGFPGGVAWGIMAAKVCQAHSKETSIITLLQYFFKTFASWNWPKPVLLKPLEDDKLKLGSWNAKNHASDRHHVMPVIAPSYPEKNVTFTVNEASLKVCKQSVEKANRQMTAVLSGELSVTDLLTTAHFHDRYKHFLLITAKAEREDNSYDWFGLVASQLRKFVAMLQSKPEIELLHANSHTYVLRDPLQRHWLVGMTFTKGMKVNMDIKCIVEEFLQRLHTLAEERNICHIGMSVEIHYQPRKSIAALGF